MNRGLVGRWGFNTDFLNQGVSMVCRSLASRCSGTRNRYPFPSVPPAPSVGHTSHMEAEKGKSLWSHHRGHSRHRGSECKAGTGISSASGVCKTVYRCGKRTVGNKTVYIGWTVGVEVVCIPICQSCFQQIFMFCKLGGVLKSSFLGGCISPLKQVAFKPI